MNFVPINPMLMTSEFQFEDEMATKVIRKSRFWLIFVLLTLIPMILIVSIWVWTSQSALGMKGFTEIITYFSPLTNWDVYFIYIFCHSSLCLPFIVYRSYNGMETNLTKFARIFSQCMHGIVCKGIK